MNKNILYLVFFVFVVACSDDNNRQERDTFDSSSFWGEWVLPHSEGSLYVDLILQSSKKATYTVFKNEVGNNSAALEETGSWSWSANRKVLGFSFLHHKVPYSEIDEISDNKLVLRNVSYNTKDTYYRVVETLKIGAGQQQPVQFLQKLDAQVSVSSSNSKIAQVSDDGTIEGIQEGVAFVIVKNGDEVLACLKVIVEGRASRFSSELFLKADDIIAKYGEPRLNVNIDETQMAMQYMFPNTGDSKLYILQYYYHKETHQIRLLNSVYFAEAEESFVNDWSYIDERYFRTDLPGVNYTEKERYWDSSYVIGVPGLSNGLYWINYVNQDYVR